MGTVPGPMNAACAAASGSSEHSLMSDMSDRRPSSRVYHRQAPGVEMVTLVNPRNGTRQEVPVRCTQTPTRPCDMLACLHILNDFLVSIGAEVKEVAFRKIAITDRQILLRRGNFNSEYVRDAVLTLYCLLSKHRCVDAMDMKVLRNLPQSTTFQSTFWRFLGCHSWVTCLELVRCVPMRDCTPSIITAISDLLVKQLIQLTLREIYLDAVTESLLDVLKKAFRNTRTLRTLSISHVGYCTKSQGVTEADVLIDQAIVQSIANNPVVTNLTFAFCYPRDACQASIRRLLENSTTLTNLTISHWALHDRAFSVKDIIGALAANRTITSLTLRDLNSNPLEKEKLVELLNSNRTLQYVAFLTRRTSLEGASTSQVPRPHVDALVKALKKTKSLERLVLNWSFSLQEIRHLAQAVHGKELRLHLLKISLDKPESFLGILDGVPGSRNVVFGECGLPEGPFLPMIPTRQVPAKQPLCSSTICTISLTNLCRVLAGDGGDCIRWLELRACENFFPEDRHYLATYLASTRRLRMLHVEIKNDPELGTAVFHGLAQNSSIEHLYIYVGCNIDEKSVELFSGWLSTNRRLHSLEVSYSYRGRERFAQALAESMHRNFTLTFIALYAADGPYYEHLCNLTWRNQGLLHCAAGFVLGCTQMRAAKAYGLLARHPLLLETVQKSRTLSKRELRAKFCTAENFRRREALMCSRYLVSNHLPHQMMNARYGH
ncbi:uncharacterized protein LOC119441801 [Dermacentor silvarum]|uniref:uncharacterized protein LOC119441801 n=1 Tax=Dermacentor silvarum TaxID=543639 RepID=UPI0021011544|nr:uncharacterized protein LOC119441801 [Dermacentor silvarum]